jgi:AraC family transcriptional regulator
MRGVRSEWACISLRPEFLSNHSVENGCETGIEIPTFTNQRDHFILALIQEIKRQHVVLGRLAPEYCDVMSAALARYLCGRYGSRDVRTPRRPMKLPPWRLRWLTEYVNDRLDRAISTAEIANEIGISVGHLHRAFRLTTGQTLLTFVNERRIRRAQQLLVSQNVPIGDIALQVGFLSPSHFARIFRRHAGLNPAEYRRSR